MFSWGFTQRIQKRNFREISKEITEGGFERFLKKQMESVEHYMKGIPRAIKGINAAISEANFERFLISFWRSSGQISSFLNKPWAKFLWKPVRV